MSKFKLEFGEYNFDKYNYMPVPPPSLNGGLYTGEPFKKDAPYRNFPVLPDASVYLQENLSNGTNAPNAAKFMYPATRVGNSYVDWKGLKKYSGTSTNWGPYNMYCAPCENTTKACFCDDICPHHQTELCNKQNCVDRKNKQVFNKYYYL